jgi:hypothetical protein
MQGPALYRALFLHPRQTRATKKMILVPFSEQTCRCNDSFASVDEPRSVITDSFPKSP